MMKNYREPLFGIIGVGIICIIGFIDNCNNNYETRIVHPVGNSTLYKVEVDAMFKPGDTIWYNLVTNNIKL